MLVSIRLQRALFRSFMVPCVLLRDVFLTQDLSISESI